ncbi:TetR/AcrR family transcriptional regulator [Paenibacillus anaericanus]|uniref:TetR/AcrR family transcriptional regulator n=1 Tax=Paenibacillus anaericanus TaxID=170367 RepID=A0A433XYZ5_9BACL|nr:TetR/AcrR family transcriptional regulator [Paenibacillus anaericanus]RUT40324.1 TetR/AcrR family transcriptional regulator [Paenibacillus anaericanus]
MRSNSKRKDLITAAAFIVDQFGMQKLTLEAVAKQAGVSKGGLLHHFPNKDALIKGMIDKYSENFINGVRGKVSIDQESRGKWHRAYLEATINDVEASNGLVTSYIAALYTDPRLISKLESDYRELHEIMNQDGLDPIKSTIIKIAIDGLWYSEIFNIGKLDNELKKEVITRLKEMINEN